MARWGAVLLLAVIGTTTAFDDPIAIFPEIARASSRIVSGWEAEEGQFPHKLSLRTVTNVGLVFACGATVIHAEWGLTAAHCTANIVAIVIRGGAVNLTRPRIFFETTKYYNHPLYNESLQGRVQPNDIGLIEFGRTLSFNEYIQPIRLQRSSAKDHNYESQRGIAAGWGLTWTAGTSSENLNWVYLTLTSNLECWHWYSGSSTIQPSTICARSFNVTSQSVCQGDSGGALTTVDEDGGLTQVGVTSFTHSSGCHTQPPAGFVRPGYYHEWFYKVTGINFDWEIDPSTETTEPLLSPVS